MASEKAEAGYWKLEAGIWKMTRVRCYAGASYPERPIAFEWEGQWLEVAKLLRRARTPEGLRFDVLAKDGRTYRLVWDVDGDSWSIMKSGEPA
jgi:hypothetical protein